MTTSSVIQPAATILTFVAMDYARVNNDVCNLAHLPNLATIQAIFALRMDCVENSVRGNLGSTA